MSAGIMVEPGAGTFLYETVRLVRRARRRPGAVLALTALAAVVTATMITFRSPPVRATVVLRMTETEPGATGIGWTGRALRGYVTEVALSRRRLRDVIDEQRLTSSAGFAPATALATLQERITVEVIWNQAIALLPPEDRPRSAHVRISFEDKDPERALAVA